jgi:DNA-binding NarL/FixJ family response regulator
VHSILIVEDTPEIAEALQRHLERRGYDTLLATRAAQALPLACSEHPDLVVLDLGLPDRDGYSVPESAAAEAAGGLSDDDLQDRFGLTLQQVVVARLLAEGVSNAEIARKLFVSGHTARNHTYRVLTKLGISRRARVNSVLRGAEAA